MLSLEQVEMKLYSLGYGGKACYFDLSSDGEPRYLASSSTKSNEDEDGSCWLGFGFEKGTDIYVAHEQTKLPGGEITSGLGTVTQMLICPIMNTQHKSLQSKIHAILNQQRFRPCQGNRLIKTLAIIPLNLCVNVKDYPTPQ